MIDDDATWFYDPSMRKSFKDGILRDEWFELYKETLFDEADYTTSKNQPDYHFFEWLSAIEIYKKTGWISLVEKYEFKKHPVQNEIYRRFVPRELYEMRNNHAQMPDLLSFPPEKTDYCFYEVKGDKDRVSKTQRDLFKDIKRITGKKVVVIKFKPLE